LSICASEGSEEASVCLATGGVTGDGDVFLTYSIGGGLDRMGAAVEVLGDTADFTGTDATTSVEGISLFHNEEATVTLGDEPPPPPSPVRR
jgi:hypothetical protein